MPESPKYLFRELLTSYLQSLTSFSSVNSFDTVNFSFFLLMGIQSGKQKRKRAL